MRFVDILQPLIMKKTNSEISQKVTVPKNGILQTIDEIFSHHDHLEHKKSLRHRELWCMIEIYTSIPVINTGYTS